MRVFPAVAACFVFSVPVYAKSLQDQLFPTATSCYARSYSAEHLVRHPMQQVTRIALAPAPEPEGGLVLQVSIELRGEAELFSGIAYCEASGSNALSCGMEGDAGGFVLTPARKGAVLLGVGRNGVGFEGLSGFVHLDGISGDDREFLLPKAAGCA